MKIDLFLILNLCAGALLSGTLLLLLSLRLAALLQQGGYSNRAFFKWYFSKGNIQRKRLSLLTLATLLLTALFCLCFSFLGARLANLISLAPFLGLCLLYLFSEKKYALKVPAKKSARFLRLGVCYFLLLFIVLFAVEFGLFAIAASIGKKWAELFRFVPVCLVILASPILLSCANFIMTLYEKPHNRRFVRRAGKKLQNASCKKIGITGSFGKTSVKHFLLQMLSTKFRVLATPASFNTPMGIARAVLETGLDCDFFLAEMGARHTGDILELCELVRPDFGIITGVCEQHIETFGSLEAIKKEKSTLARYADLVVLGASVSDLSPKRALRENVDFKVENLVCSKEGISFDLTIKGEHVRLNSGLLGKSAAQDLALCAALCAELGMSLPEIAKAVGSVTPVPHRLQKIEANGLVILDDAYNANIEGAINAVETLRLFDGKKFIVTPGLVELGELHEALNQRLGAQLVGLNVLLVGETLVLPVRKGYLEAGGDEKMLRILPTLKDAQAILAQEAGFGDVVLFLNDLPDIYR